MLSIAPTGTNPPDNAFETVMMSGRDPELLVAEERARASEAGLHLVEDHERLVPAAQRLRLLPELVRREVDPLALDRLDDERRHVAPPELAGQGRRCRRRGSCRRPGGGARNPVRNSLPPLRAQRAGGEAVEGVVAIEDARRASWRPGRT